MDQIKNALSKAGGSKGTSSGTTNTENQDYGDKGISAVEKKFGLPDNRGVNEKITDGAREQFEKATGKNVPDKFSN